MFDEFVETSIAPDGKAKVKRHVTDEETVREMDAEAMREAYGMFLTAER